MMDFLAAARCFVGLHFWRVTESYKGFIPFRRRCTRCHYEQVRRYNGYDSPHGYGGWEKE